MIITLPAGPPNHGAEIMRTVAADHGLKVEVGPSNTNGIEPWHRYRVRDNSTATMVRARVRPPGAPAGMWERYRVRVLPTSLDRYRVVAGIAWGRPRRIYAVCWHGFRDFLSGLYEREPYAVADTALARYVGAKHFRQTYPGTYIDGRHPLTGALHRACTCDPTGTEPDAHPDFTVWQGSADAMAVTFR